MEIELLVQCSALFTFQKVGLVAQPIIARLSRGQVQIEKKGKK